MAKPGGSLNGHELKDSGKGGKLSECLVVLFSCQCLALRNAQEHLTQNGSLTKYNNAVAAMTVL